MVAVLMYVGVVGVGGSGAVGGGNGGGEGACGGGRCEFLLDTDALPLAVLRLWLRGCAARDAEGFDGVGMPVESTGLWVDLGGRDGAGGVLFVDGTTGN